MNLKYVSNILIYLQLIGFDDFIITHVSNEFIVSY